MTEGRPTTQALLDRFGRLHNYLRISVTDRCNYRCTYCMPEEGLQWLPKENLLSYEEIARLVRIFAGMGLRRVRLTGGEPTVRRDILELVREIAAIPGIEDLAMTTNGHLFAPMAQAFRDAGLKRVNISIDSLDPQQFSKLTRGGKLEPVIEAIHAARRAGLTPVKLNMVVMAGTNEQEIEGMVRWCLPYASEICLRFIEYMPFESRWHTSFSAVQMRERLSQQFQLSPDQAPTGGGPARYWSASHPDFPKPLLLGFIAPLTEHFCASCNRLRLLADGDLRTCLAHEKNPNLRDLLRSGASDTVVEQVLRQIVMGKPAGHEAQTEGGRFFEGVMTGIGG